MTTMKARFTSKCANCWEAIEAGSEFQWDRDNRRGYHVTCMTVPGARPAALTDEKPRTMRARFDGKCANCGGFIEAGDEMQYARPHAFHVGCEAVAKSDPETGIDLTVLPEGTLRFAVADSEGVLRFFRIDHVPQDRERWAGNVYVKAKGGPSEGKRLGRQIVGHTYVGQEADLLKEILRDPAAAALRYGLELGECSVCGTDLTDPESRAAGIGPVCRKKFTWDRGRVTRDEAREEVA